MVSLWRRVNNLAWWRLTLHGHAAKLPPSLGRQNSTPLGIGGSLETVGFIGLGKMGSGMAHNVQKAGYPMVVHDVRRESARPFLDGGATWADSAAEVARQSDVILTSVPGPKESEHVAIGPNGLLDGIKEGAFWVDLSTTGPSHIRRLEPMFNQKGAHVLDGPILSSPDLALKRNLIEMTGGKREDFDRVKPVLDAFSDQVLYTGELGTALVVKLVTNTMGMVMLQGIAEGIILAVKAGARLEDILEVGSRPEIGGILGMMKYYFADTWFKGQFDSPIFTLALAHKDVAETTKLARETGVPMLVTSETEQIFMTAMSKGWGNRDWITLFLTQEERAGIEVRAPNYKP